MSGNGLLPQRHQVLLVNPPIIARRNARFPLAVLTLAAALDERYGSSIVDGSIDSDFIAKTLRNIRAGHVDALGVTVMGGPQLRPAIELSKAVRAISPSLPIIWGGAFPTNCPEATLNVPYVDYAIRGQGEVTFVELLDALFGDVTNALSSIAGLSWVSGGRVTHNPPRAFSASSLAQRLPYERLDNPTQYLPHTYLGRRTAGYQAGLGCRFRCTFCGVAAMFRGRLALPTATRLEEDLQYLTTQLGVDGIQFYDHNFFDREVDMVPLLEVLAKFQLPWWCYARSDALANLSERSWALVRRSRLRMAYIGAESPSDWLLHAVRKGTHADQTLAAIEACRAHGVIPELSFMLAPPQDPEGETERTLEFIHQIKRRWPETEVMIYIYTPLPPPPDSTDGAALRGMRAVHDQTGQAITFPATADEWAQPQWQAYWCHSGAPWVSDRLRQRIRDFTTVLGCRFPTVMDVRAPSAGKTALRLLASWRYRYRRYDRPWELELCKKMIKLRDPRAMSL
jgi:radical SAM superfamily enzyme YgiQ (UPF0313 family)